jgi:hypothetical protein
MATVVKNFRIKSGLIVEGTTATVNGQNILSETGGDAYILNLVGGATLVKSVDSGVFGVDSVGNLTINANTFDSYGSASAAQSAAATDATSKANAAQAAAEATASADATSKATAAQAAAEATASADATSKANAAQAAAEATALADATSKANAAQAAAEATASADATSKANAAQAAAEATASADATSKANAAQAAAEAYTDSEVAALVDSAPELLDTLNELAAAIADNPNYASDVANLVATKADTSYVNSEISDLDIAAQGYASAAQSAAASDAIFKANAAKSEAKSYTDDKTLALGDAFVIYANGTKSEAIATSAAYVENFTTTAINALDTDDIEEGSNLYFTDARARYALQGQSPNFATVDLNFIAKQVAARYYPSEAGVHTVYTFAANEYGSAEFLVKVSHGSHTEISKVLLTVDDSYNIAFTEYGIVGTNGSLSTVSAEMIGNSLNLLVTVNTDRSEVTVVGTLLI